MIQRRNENFIILLVSLACIGLTIESIMMGWEFWVPPLIVIGTVSLWVMNITEKPPFEVRKVAYLVFAMLTSLFHGVHETSFFDVSMVTVLMMVGFSFLGRAYMMHLFLAEYTIVMIIQHVLAFRGESTEFTALNISRIILHAMIVGLVYACCVKVIRDRQEVEVSTKEKDDLIESYDADMEDFLSNISHELRTPVNVVNGMSELLIKKNAGSEAYNIKNAGIRLAYQIEDIQDYTECKRKKVMLEEEDYMSTSLINDVVESFRLVNDSDALELVVDLDPSVPTKMHGDIKKLHMIFRHLLENSVKFTKRGGIYVRMSAERKDYGVNLCIEMTDTGIGMDRKAIHAVAEGLYQANKKRNRSSGGIGLGLYIVYGFAHRMNGFVKIESRKNGGTTVRVTIPQKTVDERPCLALPGSFFGDILFHVKTDKFTVPKVRDFYSAMASNLAVGLKVPLYSADSVKEIERLREKLNVTFIFTGREEYEEDPEYFEALSRSGVVVAVTTSATFKLPPGSKVISMPKPLYAYPVIKLLNEGPGAQQINFREEDVKPSFSKVKALIVDDEPMNLIVATGLFKDYDMSIDTANSGAESIEKFRSGNYDVIFMDHMMPEMDGVEAMKRIKKTAEEMHRTIKVVALTANAVSGAREMFMREGFDGFIAKPINMANFERVMLQVLPESKIEKGGKRA
ncbi:MAG: response regulator [Lachnospiraceae bacterium]|nr:response regulator [Lachnospiraceae bacterium]